MYIYMSETKAESPGIQTALSKSLPVRVGSLVVPVGVVPVGVCSTMGGACNTMFIFILFNYLILCHSYYILFLIGNIKSGIAGKGTEVHLWLSCSVGMGI